MALTLTIEGNNFLSQYKTNSAQITERLNNRANTLNLTIIKKSGDSTPSEGAEIILKDGARFLFGGFVDKVSPVETGEGDMFEYDVEATDYTYILINKSAQKTYENQTLGAIVSDLLSEYVDAGYGITTNNVATGPTINTIAFDHINLRKAFEKLSSVTGYQWYVDYEKDIHFFQKDSASAPESFTDTSGNLESITIDCDTSQVRNSVVVRGGREEIDNNFSQVFVGDGEKREWILREKPKTMVDIEIDTGGGYTSQDFGVDPIDDETGNDFMFNYQEKYIRATSTTTTPAEGDLIRVTYKYEIPILVKLQNAASIAAMKAIEGGDGIHAHVVTRNSIKSKEEAREVALNQIEQHGDPLVEGEIKTRSGLLQAGSVFKPGQQLTLNMPTWGINSDTDYLIQKVAVSLLEDGNDIEYHYNISFGGRLIGIREFLESLAGREEVILDTEEIDRIEAFNEEVNIAETITREPNTNELSETISIGEEEPLQASYAPPLKWGVGNRVSRWRFRDYESATEVKDELGAQTGVASVNTDQLANYDSERGQCFLFGGSEAITFSTLAPPSSGFSFSFWFNLSNSGGSGHNSERFIDCLDSGLTSGFAMLVNSSSFLQVFLFPGFVTLTGSTAINEEQWYHASVAYANNDVEIYLDGTSEDSSASVNMTTPTNDTIIAANRDASTNFLNGKLQDMVYFERRISDTEAAQMARRQARWNNFEWG